MENLPKGWVKTEINQIGEAVTGNTPSRKVKEYFGGSIPWIKPGDLKDSFIRKSEESLTDTGADKSRTLPPNSVMISCIGNLGKVGYMDKVAATNQQINSIVFNEKLVIPKYGFYYSLTLKKWLYENSSATTVSIINKGKFAKAPFLLAPLAEQQRIVAKLDTLFASLERTESRLAKIPQLLKNFRQAVLTQAVTGKLTAEWREGKELEDVDKLLTRLTKTRISFIEKKIIRNVTLKETDKHDNLGIIPSKWRKVSLYDVANIIDPNPSHRMPVYYDTGIPFLSTENIRGDKLDFNKGKKVGESTLKEQVKRFNINTGDFIYTRIGTIGKSCYLPIDRTYCLSHAVCVISSYDKLELLSEYLRIIIGSKKIIEQGLNGVKSVGVPDLGMGKVRCFQIPICTREEQQEIVHRVESLLAKGDAIEKQYKNLKQKIDVLPQALLAKAFKGELVEQLPTDGDARDLLAEIQNAKESLNTKAKGRKKIKEDVGMVAEPREAYGKK